MLLRGFTRAAAIGVIGATTLISVGCQTVQRGTTMARWDEGGIYPIVTTCQSSGEYAIYASSDVKPIIVVQANKGDALGFEKMGDHIVAIAGSFKQELPDGTYYWNER